MNEFNEVSQQITKLFEMLNVEVPSHDTDLFDSGLLDSLMFVELLMQLEAQMSVSVSLEQLEPENFRSIQHITSFVLRQRGAAISA